MNIIKKYHYIPVLLVVSLTFINKYDYLDVYTLLYNSFKGNELSNQLHRNSKNEDIYFFQLPCNIPFDPMSSSSISNDYCKATFYNDYVVLVDINIFQQNSIILGECFTRSKLKLNRIDNDTYRSKIEFSKFDWKCTLKRINPRAFYLNIDVKKEGSNSFDIGVWGAYLLMRKNECMDNEISIETSYFVNKKDGNFPKKLSLTFLDSVCINSNCFNYKDYQNFIQYDFQNSSPFHPQFNGYKRAKSKRILYYLKNNTNSFKIIKYSISSITTNKMKPKDVRELFARSRISHEFSFDEGNHLYSLNQELYSEVRTLILKPYETFPFTFLVPSNSSYAVSLGCLDTSRLIDQETYDFISKLNMILVDSSNWFTAYKFLASKKLINYLYKFAPLVKNMILNKNSFKKNIYVRVVSGGESYDPFFKNNLAFEIINKTKFEICGSLNMVPSCCNWVNDNLCIRPNESIVIKRPVSGINYDDILKSVKFSVDNIVNWEIKDLYGYK